MLNSNIAKVMEEFETKSRQSTLKKTFFTVKIEKKKKKRKGKKQIPKKS